MTRMKTLSAGGAVLLLALSLVVWSGSGVRAADPTPDPHHPAPTATAPASAATSDSNHAQHYEGTAEATASSCATPGSTAMSGSGSGMDDQGMMGGTPMPGMGTAGAGMMGEFDLMFIDMMIPHHESAVAMAQVALTRAEHEQIRQFAQDIVTSQSAEIDQLRAWRSAWYPDAPSMPMDNMMAMMQQMMQGMAGMEATHGMMGMTMDATAEVQALCDASGPFDLAFIDAMTHHHQGAVLMAQVALQHATHPELAQLAQQIIDAQQREIGQMQQWRVAWYGATPWS